MSQPFKLYRLQQIDSQLDRIRSRLAEIEAALCEDEALRQAKQKAADALAALETERKALRQAEQAVNEQRMKIEQTEATLYGGKVRNPKELQDLQSEVAALKRFRSVLEDRQLEHMLAVEELEAGHEAAEAEQATAQAEFDQKHRQLVAERENLQHEQARIETERQAAASSIPAEDLALYEQLRKQRRGVAVAKVTDKSCSACGSMLSAAQLHAALSPSQITRCATCSRILYAG